MGEGTGGTGDAAAAGGARQARKHVFSWEQLPEELGPTKRFNLWQDMFAGLYGSADFDASRNGPLHASFEFLGIGEVALNRLDCTLSRYARTAAHVATDARDDILIGFSKGGAAHGHFGRKELEIPGGAAFVATNSVPLTNVIDARIHSIGLALPRSLLASAMGDERGFEPRLLSFHSPAVRHLQRYAEFLLGDSQIPDDARLVRRLETTLIDLIALALDAEGDAARLAQERGLRAARLAAIKADIRENMRHPRFTIAAVAMRQGVTPRYIQILFESEGRTFTEYVHEQRLKEAYRMLTSPAYGGMRIGDIAFTVGFSDQTTFNRNFKSAYGATPTEIRETARQRG